MTNVNGNNKKNLPVKYSRVTAAKSRIRGGYEASKKWAVGIGKKTTGQQRFLGKTLPKALFKVAKWGFRNPLTVIGGTLAYKGDKALGTKWGRGYNYSKLRQFDKKGRKII